jgi:hypothetical protein
MRERCARAKAGYSWSSNVVICAVVSGKLILRLLRSGVRTLVRYDTTVLHPKLNLRAQSKRVLRTRKLSPKGGPAGISNEADHSGSGNLAIRAGRSPYQLR